MKIKVAAAVLLLSLFSTSASANRNWNGITITQTILDGRPCFFFLASGVNEADPVVPGGGWFAVPMNNPNYNTIVSIIISARLSGTRLNLSTDGTTSCGWATLAGIGFQ